jgi:hypothetical protein
MQLSLGFMNQILAHSKKFFGVKKNIIFFYTENDTKYVTELFLYFVRREKKMGRCHIIDHALI